MPDFYDNRKLFNAIVDDVISKNVHHYGYKMIKSGKWIKEDHELYKKGIQVYSLKAGSKVPVWGVSLNFCPTFDGKVTWHRTVKSADIHDICFDPVDYQDPRTCSISPFHAKNEEDLVVLITKIISSTLAESEYFYKQIQDLKDVELLFKEKINRKFIRFGFNHYTQHLLAYACLLKKIGRTRESKEYFDTFASFYKDTCNMSEIMKIYDDLV